MKNTKNKNGGFSFLSAMLLIVFLAIMATFGTQIGLGYLEQNTLKAAAKAALMDAKQDEQITERKIKDDIMKRISTNNITVQLDDITIEKNGGGFKVSISHTKEIKLNAQIKIIMDLDVTEEN